MNGTENCKIAHIQKVQESLRKCTNALFLTFTVIHNQNRVQFRLPSLLLEPTVIESSKDKTAIHRSVLGNDERQRHSIAVHELQI